MALKLARTGCLPTSGTPAAAEACPSPPPSSAFPRAPSQPWRRVSYSPSEASVAACCTAWKLEWARPGSKRSLSTAPPRVTGVLRSHRSISAVRPWSASARDPVRSVGNNAHNILLVSLEIIQNTFIYLLGISAWGTKHKWFNSCEMQSFSEGEGKEFTHP